MLAFVSGIVNVVGVLSVHTLTTNVTGHFAYMIEEASQINTSQALFFLVYVLFFLLGAFFSNFIIELTSKVTDRYIFIIPIVTETLILTTIGLLNFDYIVANTNLIACALLFAMGLQNSLVTTISNSVVRTTHSTGLFTDLGIEISQLFFFKSFEYKYRLISSIKLRLTIIITFFLGGIFAGFMFSSIKTRTLLFASATLLLGLLVNYIIVKSKVYKLKKKKIKR